jgi:signal transduction histidine kinase/DNA-binding response OmpR family regulator
MIRNLKLLYLIPGLLALAMIIYGVVASSVNTSDNLRDSSEVAHGRRVLVALQETVGYMLDLETGQRGFIITGDEAYLKPYESALEKLNSPVAALAVLTRDNPSQQLKIGMIQEVVSQRKISMAHTIAIRRKDGLEAAVADVQHTAGKDQMDRIRQLIDEMRDDEVARIDLSLHKLAENLKRTNFTVTVAGIVAITSGVTGVLLMLLFLSASGREQDQRLQKEKAEDADHAKSEFLAMMSHEIRTPMNAILGFGELLHDMVESPQEKHFASAILSSGNSLLSLINDILDLSKIEAGKLDLHPETILMEQFAENLQTLFSFRAVEKGLEYSIKIDPQVPPQLSFDALRLRQVLVNLVGNAIKFTREGSISVSLRTGPVTTGDSVMLSVEVADTGIGISADQVVEIFRPFYQIDSRQGREFQGTGLGLSISRRLVEAMAGSIAVESVVGQGSVFRVALPVRLNRRPDDTLAAEPDAGPVDFNLLKPSKILVADDVPLNRDLIKSYLAGTRHQVIEAEDGEQAVKLCLKHQPDLVLMDIRMPALDGQEALTQLKSREETRHIPVIAVTASSLLNSQQELKSTFDGYADKPLNRGKLFAELAKFIPLAERLHRTVEKAPQPATEPALANRDWTELCAALDDLHATVWPNLVKLVPAQATLKFSKRLAELAEQFSCPLLAEHARQLTLSSELMDFPRSSRLLESFPQVIATLRSSHA